MPMERAPFGCLTDEPPWYMITPMHNASPLTRPTCPTLPIMVITKPGISEIYYRV